MAERPRAIVPVARVDDRFIRVILYGDPGVGKTRFICTSNRGLILNADPYGTVSGAIAGSKCDRWDIEDHNTMLEAYEYLRHGGTKDYDWVWLDSITIFQERGLDQIMRDLIAGGKAHRKVYLPDQAEWGQNQRRIKIWCRDMTALPINFGITAHVMSTEDEDGNVLRKPSIQGKQGEVSDVICGYMGMVAYMFAARREGEIRRGIQVVKDSKHVAKDRYDAVPGGKLMNPTVPKLEELIKAKLPKPQPNGRPSTKRRAATTVRSTAAQRQQTRTRSS